MQLALAAAILLLQVQTQDSTRALPVDVYLDPGAAALHEAATERRERVDRSIDAYTAVVTERIEIGLRALRRDRMLFRRETAARLSWQREGPIGIEILGAREVLPTFTSKPQVPAGLHGFVPHLAFDPADDHLQVGLRLGEFVRHPLAGDAGRNYRFRSGDTTSIKLPDGRAIRLIELRVLPRRKDYRLFSGSIWIDEASKGIVQAVFRLARPYDVDIDAPDDDMPGALRPFRAGVEFVSVEYGLWDLQWWLPRTVALEGVAEAGAVARAPFRYEIVYADYEVVGTPGSRVVAALTDSAGNRVKPERCRTNFTVQVQVKAGSPGKAAAKPAADPESAAAPDSAAEKRREKKSDPACERYAVTIPDSASLLTSGLLPADPYAQNEPLVVEAELEELARAIGALPEAPWQIGRPFVRWRPFGQPRYNRVEGLSFGVASELDLGPLRLFGHARLGLADLEPKGQLGIQRDTESRRLRLAAYHRLTAMDPSLRPLALGYSLNSLLFGNDEADFYRATGVELTGAPAPARTPWYDWRLFAQQERSAEKETDFSARRLLDDGHAFAPNLTADRADLIGGSLDLNWSRGLDPAGFRWGAAAGLKAATGTYEFVLPSAMLRVDAPLPGPLVGAAELAAGTSSGELPVQHRWFLGGTGSLRGYDAGIRSGETFWRARAEIATALPMARLVLFGDAGTAGPRSTLSGEDPLVSAGVGVSILDGLLRLDLARALRAPTGWRLSIHADAGL